MSIAFEAAYGRNLLHLLRQLNLVEGEKVSVTLLEPAETKLAAMRKALSDPLFLADLQEIAEDFSQIG